MICINNNTFSMFTKRTPISKITNRNSILALKRNITQFNYPELLKQLEKEQHRFTQEQMTFLKTLITDQSNGLTAERMAMPGKAKDRDFTTGQYE
jgi:hypothetical protein